MGNSKEYIWVILSVFNKKGTSKSEILEKPIGLGLVCKNIHANF